ncbi:MAG: iron-containing alcohol dehydrogenase [Ideonella sp.]|nr:iron-containing alcohol dehydrogenase [Ideonella sp.]MBL0147472.1 iron-containing alcohol dehydrogenase [Ideonella sp.]
MSAQERIVHGVPAGAAVLAEAERLGAQRVFLISGRTLGALTDGPLQRVAAALGARHAGTFAAVRAHSPREDVVAAAAAARACGADLLVGIGGGSAIDAAKAVQLCLWHGLTSAESMEPYRTGAAAESARAIAPPPDAIRMLAVSTTLSASEFTAMAGITDSATQAKQMFAHRLMVPRVAVLDPAATLDTPEGLLFSTAIRSVDHAVETWCSPLATPATEALSLQGLRLLARALPAIQAAPQALAPRLDAQFGMWQAIAALAAGVQTGASHGIGYALGAGFNVPHGHTSCVLLPAVLQWNAAANAARQQALSQAMGAPDRPAHELVRGLIAGLGQPVSLRAVGLREDQLGDLAQRALAYPPVQANPRPIRGVEDVREILALAW